MDEITIEDVLNFLVFRLKELKIILTFNSRDGRINSAQDEDQLLLEIKNDYEINEYFIKNKILLIEPKMRDWFDFGLNLKNIFFPINIKSSNLNKTQNDNLNSKLGIYYALTGKIPHFDNEIKWEIFFRELSENFENTNNDYYFLVINKNQTNDIFWTSLKKIEILTPTGNNLPFQCTWSKNRNHVNRTYDEAKEFIMSFFEKSIQKRTKILEDFNKYFRK